MGRGKSNGCPINSVDHNIWTPTLYDTVLIKFVRKISTKFVRKISTRKSNVTS